MVKQRYAYPRVNTTESTFMLRKTVFDGVESDGSYWRLARMSLYADTATVRRKKPELPHLFPTTLKRMQLHLNFGVGDCAELYTQGNRRVNVCSNFGWYPPFGGNNYWKLVPGLTYAKDGTATGIVRSIDQETLAHNKLLSHIKNATLNVPVAILEARQTASWIASRAASVTHCVRAMKGSKWDKFRKLVNSLGDSPPKQVTVTAGRYGYKPDRLTLYRDPNRLPPDPPDGWSSMDAADRWLEVKYALGPFLSDVEGGAKALASFIVEKQLTYMSAYARQIYRRNLTTPLASTGYGYCAAVPEFTVNVISTYRVKVNYLIDQYFAAFIQLNLVSAPSTLYELMPYSFVLDWGVGIGEYLDLLDATVPCVFVSGTSSYTLLSSGTECTAGLSPGGAKVIRFEKPTLSVKCYSRSTLGAFPTPGIVVKSPLSSSHVTTAAALLRGTFSR